MTSRTPEGKHTKRFIVLKKELNGYIRSNTISQAYPTREEAQSAINTLGTPGVEYKIRQK